MRKISYQVQRFLARHEILVISAAILFGYLFAGTVAPWLLERVFGDLSVVSGLAVVPVVALVLLVGCVIGAICLSVEARYQHFRQRFFRTERERQRKQ